VVDRAHEELGAEDAPRENPDGAHGDQVKNAVIDAGVRGYSCMVAVLVGVGHRDQYGLHHLAVASDSDGASLAPAAHERGERRAGVGEKAAALEAVETAAHLGVEAEPHRIDEGEAVDRPGVQLRRPPRSPARELEGLGEALGQPQVKGEPVA
jgi:hypothetical protein